MSGPEETSESAVDSASPAEGAPATPAPPSFGRAGEAAAEPAARPQAAKATAEAEPKPAAPTFTVPLFGPDKPWWAASEEERQAAGADSGPAADVSDAEAAATEDASQTDGPAEEAKPAAPAAGGPAAEAAAEPAAEPAPGVLVAGVGVPSVDTRGAVPPEPIKELPGPSFPDTDPDGIPLYPGPQEEHRPEREAGREKAPAAEASTAEQVSQEQAEPSRNGKSAPEARQTPVQDAASDDSDDSDGALTPDAVLPPGVTPPEYTGHHLDGLPHTTSAAPADQLSEGGVILLLSQAPPHAAQEPPQHGPERRPASAEAEQPVVRRRNQLMIAVVAIVIAIPAIVLAGFGLFSGSGEESPRAAKRPSRSASPAPERSAPAAPPAASPASPSPTRTGPSRIDNEKTDPRPLALVEVFPSKEIELADRVFLRDMTSVNHQCGLTARGAMIEALERGNCRSVVRATYVNRVGTIAVTAGVAVMPTRKAALAAHRAGDPAAYEWFRGMPGERSPDIDRAGGHAAGTVRGRYIVYAYATYADGTTPKPGDRLLKQIAEEFIAYGLRPIDKRAAEGS